MQFLALAALIATFAADDPLTPPPPIPNTPAAQIQLYRVTQPEPPQPEAQVIVNYWIHINDLINSEKLRRNAMTIRPGGKYVARKTYPFDGFGHLRARDLIRAAQEGIEAARTTTWGKPQEEVDREISKNINTAFEYYPLLAQGDDDVRALYLLVENSRQEDLLRMFLIQNSVKGKAHPSLFGTYFREAVERDPAPLREILQTLVNSPVESPRLLSTAIHALFEILYYEHGVLISKEATLSEFAKQKGVPVSLALLSESGAPPLTGDIARLNEDFEAQWFDIARTLKTYCEPENARTEELTNAAQTHLRRICEEIPLKKREDIRKMLEEVEKSPRPS